MNGKRLDSIVGEWLTEKGVPVTHETVEAYTRKFLDANEQSGLVDFPGLVVPPTFKLIEPEIQAQAQASNPTFRSLGT